MEIDCYPKNKPELADKVDGAIGEGSRFHALYGYYAQGVGPKTSVLPDGWEDRLIAIQNENRGGVAGLCLEVHDLAIAKLIAGRPKDIDFVRLLSTHEMIDDKTMLKRLLDVDLERAFKKRVGARIKAAFL